MSTTLLTSGLDDKVGGGGGRGEKVLRTDPTAFMDDMRSLFASVCTCVSIYVLYLCGIFYHQMVLLSCK